MKTILILSQDYFEGSTEKVIDWILNKGCKFERVNGSVIENLNLNIEENFNSRWKFIKTNINDIHSIWFRRWGAGRQSIFNISELVDKSENLNNNFRKYLAIVNNMQDEFNSLSSYFFQDLSKLNKKFLTKPFQVNVNKLTILQSAISVGLLVPEYALINNKVQLLDYKLKWKKLITKDINIQPSFISDKESFVIKTQLIDKKAIDLIPDMFEVSFIQKYIEKKYEIRAFYFREKIYSMAIFSQSDNKTRIDFRNYNESRPNRTVPYKLPEEIELKIMKLMKIQNLDTGSIDLIKNENKYYFLEVNPVGQFEMVSLPCNYNLEEIIAEYLVN